MVCWACPGLHTHLLSPEREARTIIARKLGKPLRIAFSTAGENGVNPCLKLYLGYVSP